MTNRNLEGRIAVVTGAGSGIGEAIALELGTAGASIAIAEVDKASGRAQEELLRSRGIDAQFFHVDVADSSSVDTGLDMVVDTFGRLDILVNNAGVSHVGPHIQDTTDDVWTASIGVMQTGVFNCMRSAGRFFLPQGSGSVVNISSIRGFSSNPGRVAYCAAKAAVLMMTKVVAAEWAPYGVRVNAIAPGVMRTPMWDYDVERGVTDEQAYLDIVPAGRIGDPVEVGRLAAYLCSDNVPYLTGATLTIDGGLTCTPIG